MLPGLGSVLNDTYRLERELGRGGLGTVYAGLDLGRSVECAIRILPPEAGDMQVERERFLRDHRIAKEISDGRLPEALDVATTESGQLFIVTPLCRGETLRQRLRRGALPQRSAFALVQRMCDILEGLHGRGVPHGGLHPENVVLGKDETILLLDLGLHHFMVGPLHSFPRRAPGVGWYVPPEIVESQLREADIRGDVFALGAILYEALAGRPAFPEPPGAQVFRGRSGMAQLARAVAPWELSPLLERILDRACAQDPQDRPPDAQALAQELRALEAQFPEAHQPEARAAGQVSSAGTPAPEEAAAEPGPPERPASEPPSRRSKRRPLLHSADGEAQGEQEQASAEGAQGGAVEGPAAAADSGARAHEAPGGEAAADPQADPLSIRAMRAVQAPAGGGAAGASSPVEGPKAGTGREGPHRGEARPGLQGAGGAAAEVPVKDKPLSPVAARLAALARGEFKPATSLKTPRPAGTQDAAGKQAAGPGHIGKLKLQQQPREASESGASAASPAPSAMTIMAAPEAAAPASQTAVAAAPAPQTAAAAAPAPGDTAAPVPAPETGAVWPSPPAESAPVAAAEPTEAAREAAKAIAAARVAAAARLLEAARATARTAVPQVQARLDQQAVPEPAPTAGSSPSKRRRRAPADLQELPPASGELVTDPREPPTLESSQIIVSLPGSPAGPGERHAPPPLPAAVTQLQRPVPGPAPSAASTKPTAKIPAAPTTKLAAAPTAEVAPSLDREARSAAVIDPEAVLPIDGGDGDDEVLRTEELKAIRVAPRPAGPGLQWALLAVAVLGGLGFLALRLLPPPQAPAPVVSAPDPAALQAQQIAQKIDETDRALGAQDWHAALLRTDEVLRLQPDHAGAQQRRRRAESELANQIRFESFRAMAQRQNQEAALALFSEITDDSVYKGPAREVLQGVRTQYIADKLQQAQRARRLGLCAEVQRLTRAVLAVDPGPGPTHDEAVALAERCQAAREDGPGRREAGAARPQEPRAEHPKERHEPETPEAPGSTLKALRDPFR